MKKIKELKPGDVFITSLGDKLKVEKIVPLKWNGISGTKPKVKVYFITERNNRMYMNYSADLDVEINKP